MQSSRAIISPQCPLQLRDRRLQISQCVQALLILPMFAQMILQILPVLGNQIQGMEAYCFEPLPGEFVQLQPVLLVHFSHICPASFFHFHPPPLACKRTCPALCEGALCL